MQSKSRILNFILSVGVIMPFIFLSGCSGSSTQTTDDSAAVPAATGEYHADYDIAMTIASIIDAMKVNQPLDSTEYNYRGILTDGSGRPLYTDIQGTPGDWEVKITSSQSASIRNLYLGDLLPDDLKTYILTCLGLPDTPVMETEDQKSSDTDKISVYDFGSGDLIFRTQTAKTESDESGPLLTILIRKEKL